MHKIIVDIETTGLPIRDNGKSANPSIFEIDYEFLKNRLNTTYGEELMAIMYHPKNINKFKDWDLI